MLEAEDLGVVNGLKLCVGLIGDLAVSHNAGAMDKTADLAVFGLNFLEDGTYGCAVAHVDRAIDPLCAGLFNTSEVAADFALGENSARLFAELEGVAATDWIGARGRA